MGRNKMTGRSGQIREPPRFIRVFVYYLSRPLLQTEARGLAVADSRREGKTFMRCPARVLRNWVRHQFRMGPGAANQVWSNSYAFKPPLIRSQTIENRSIRGIASECP